MEQQGAGEDVVDCDSSYAKVLLTETCCHCIGLDPICEP